MLNFLTISYLRAFKISCSVELSMKSFITLGSDLILSLMVNRYKFMLYSHFYEEETF